MRFNPSSAAFWAAVVYLGLGLLAGIFSREYTRGTNFEGVGASELGVTHTHLLVLGFIIMLIVVLFDATVGLTSKLFPWFFWVYNVGLVISIGTLFVRGMSTISGNGLGAALSGIAGLGHILLAAGLIILMVLIGKRMPKSAATPTEGQW